MCLKSSRSSVLVNGSPSYEFPIKRGLRQGDPLSPFLFIIVMEGLNILLKNAIEANLIRGTVLGNGEVNISHLFYADDVIITTDWNISDMENILRVFHIFFAASGLKLNVAKFEVHGVSTSVEEVDFMARCAGCRPGNSLFSYLGLLVGRNMNSIKNWDILIERFKKRLSSWKVNLLSIGGRLTLVKSVFGSLGILMRSEIKWSNVMSSMVKGGLNVGSIKALNIALIQKWRWRLHVCPNSLWSSVVSAIHGTDGGVFGSNVNGSSTWSNVVKLIKEMDKKDIIPLNSLRRRVGNGISIKFWKDHWIGEGPLFSRYNRLAHLDSNIDCTLADKLVNGSWVWSWLRELGSRNETLFSSMLAELASVQLSNIEDSWSWSLASDGCFSIHDTRAKVYNLILPSLSPSTRWYKIIPRKVWSKVRRWIDCNMPVFNSWSDWMLWFEHWSGSEEVKTKIYTIVAACIWLLWRYRNGYREKCNVS
ncbi:uncharacterized protein [Rutidosis leptorrhynchoides]|uniref:uncharacterized protein n=1 Tax=Rutidosis leptorrhynchoides TaxID=125765 RepID=UPI003A99D864